MKKRMEKVRTALADRYDVVREIGRGSMATVFLAEDRETSRRVAIKALHNELRAALQGGGRFQREIDVLRKLQHPNILPILDSADSGDVLYYVMPYACGGSLHTRIAQDGPWPLARALPILRDVAAALDYAHGQNVIHRDIKPGNILFGDDACAQTLVCDFGLARAIVVAGGERISSSGLVVGTPAYLSPEQAAGLRDLDGRCDVYGLGCVIYEMLTGELPFTGPTAQSVIARHLREPPRSIRVVRPELPQQVEDAVFAALAKRPEDRPGTAGEVVRRMAA
jgi:serine/threonine-protein kinase